MLYNLKGHSFPFVHTVNEVSPKTRLCLNKIFSKIIKPPGLTDKAVTCYCQRITKQEKGLIKNVCRASRIYNAII